MAVSVPLRRCYILRSVIPLDSLLFGSLLTSAAPMHTSSSMERLDYMYGTLCCSGNEWAGGKGTRSCLSRSTFARRSKSFQSQHLHRLPSLIFSQSSSKPCMSTGKQSVAVETARKVSQRATDRDTELCFIKLHCFSDISNRFSASVLVQQTTGFLEIRFPKSPIKADTLLMAIARSRPECPADEISFINRVQAVTPHSRSQRLHMTFLRQLVE